MKKSQKPIILFVLGIVIIVTDLKLGPDVNCTPPGSSVASVACSKPLNGYVNLAICAVGLVLIIVSVFIFARKKSKATK